VINISNKKSKKRTIDLRQLLLEKAIKIDISPILHYFEDNGKSIIHEWFYPRQKVIVLSIEGEKLLIYNYGEKKIGSYSAKNTDSNNYEQFALSDTFYIMESKDGASVYSYPSMSLLYSTSFLDLTLPTAGITTTGNNLLCNAN
jgi:hypothetical protein